MSRQFLRRHNTVTDLRAPYKLQTSAKDTVPEQRNHQYFLIMSAVKFYSSTQYHEHFCHVYPMQQFLTYTNNSFSILTQQHTLDYTTLLFIYTCLVNKIMYIKDPIY